MIKSILFMKYYLSDVLEELEKYLYDGELCRPGIRITIVMVNGMRDPRWEVIIEWSDE